MNHSSKREEIQWEICCCSWEIWETFLVFLFIECYGAAAFCGWIFPIVDVENCNGLLSDGAPEWAVPQHPARGYVTWHKWTTDDHRCNNGRSHRLSFTFQNIQWISIIFEPMKFQESFKLLKFQIWFLNFKRIQISKSAFNIYIYWNTQLAELFGWKLSSVVFYP